MRSAVEQLSKLILNGLAQVVQFLLNVSLGHGRVNEFHFLQILDNGLGEGLLDESHRDLLGLALLRFEQHLLAALVVSDNTFHHADGLGQGAVVVVLGESVLLKELILDKLGDFEGGLLVLTKGVLSDQLDNFDQIILFLENLLHDVLKSHEVGVSLVVVVLESSIVVRVRDVPVHRREMLSLGKLLVQTPEDLHDIEGSGSNGIGEITTGR
mmetsp:Transcript_8187/g.12551  ORF Transcript_8187/g.12551 Transcript_8187/m.12551 type:complete len:212 (+) Transcript_8187:21-656(+)